MAPLDVVQADSTVATDKQALISSQSALNYQQQIIKQAIARNLNDPALAAAPVIPTDRVSLDATAGGERSRWRNWCRTAFKQRPELEQAVLTLQNDEITLKGARNAAAADARCVRILRSRAHGWRRRARTATNFRNRATRTHRARYPTSGYGTVLSNLFNSSAPDKGVGFNLTIPIRNREAQSVAGAVADGVSPGGVAAGATLHADPDAGGERAVCA